MKVIIAVGGNAMTSADSQARPADQVAAVTSAMRPVADLVTAGVDVVLTHGNGPQVGNLLVKNELAATVVPAVPLDWCGAQTQGTIGFIVTNALERALADRNSRRRVAAVVTRTRVDESDPGLLQPTKPIGRYVTREEALRFIERGQIWEDRGERGWRRMVASPEPLEILDAPTIAALVTAGFVVVANGGGGVPVVRTSDGAVRGVEAVIDKDLGAALLGRALEAEMLVIATDVDGAFVDFGTPRARRLGRVSAARLRDYAAAGHFAGGSMGPKVEAACRFVEEGGRRAVITSLERIAEAIHAEVGTTVVPAAETSEVDHEVGEVAGNA